MTTDDKDTTAWDKDGAGGDETAVVPPVKQPEPSRAWAECDDEPDPSPTSWRTVWGIAGVLMVCAVAAAFVVAMVALMSRHHDDVPPPAWASASPTDPLPPQGVSPSAAPVNDDAYVSIAFSLRNHLGGAGTAGTQARADEIAIAECKTHGDDLCMVAARGHLECLEYVYDDSDHWASGSGPDPAAADADARGKLIGKYAGGGMWCSTPPGNPKQAN